MTYTPERPARSEFVALRNLRIHVNRWDAPAPPEAPLLVLAHGWMDVGASYQFVVDAFSQAFAARRVIIAPDWRGFGRTVLSAPCDHYVFADYLGDLDALLDHYAPGGQPVDLVGHSMGGNVAMQYAGARPGRIRRLVDLEGFGMPVTRPEQAPPRLARWLDELKALRQGGIAMKAYASLDDVAQRLMKNNRRLPPDKAQWLAGQWARQTADGRWQVMADAAHKVVNPILSRVEETLALYAAIAAPVLSVEAGDDSLAQRAQDPKRVGSPYTLADYHARLKHVPHHQIAVVPDAGHMLHHDQPRAVAGLIEAFLAQD
jgi:pimeloyl-ACP methyl ester carboxylesterase